MATRDMAMALRAAYFAVHRQTSAHLLPLGITADQFVCLLILNGRNGITQQELAARALSDPNTMRAMLLLLERKRLINRRRNPTDRRAQRVYMSAKGAAVFRRSVKALLPVRRRMLDPFPSARAREFVRYLNRLAADLRK